MNVYQKSSKLFLMQPFINNDNTDASQGSEKQRQTKERGNQSMILAKCTFHGLSIWVRALLKSINI
jgi:hypothetical protein